jgi:hypothetical protein
MTAGPFDALGLPARPDLDDEQVRAAWREIAAATHPDRPDGGDPARYAQASAAYAELRTPWGRSEAYADLTADVTAGLSPGLTAGLTAGLSGGLSGAGGPGTVPLPVIPAEPVQHVRLRGAVLCLPERIWHGRRLRLLVRALAAALLSFAVLALIPGQPAAPAVITGLIIWFVLTGRADLAPPPRR